jgi:O-acetyl-ADP-ribose deacetylase (regulator of RNase III)
VDIEVKKGSILGVDADAIVNAANSQGWMGGGVAGAIKRAAGTVIEKEAVAKAPVPIGEAVLTSGGETKFKGIIHAPTMEHPAMRIPPENVSKATRAAIELADREGFETLAIPGMGTGVGGVGRADAAAAMVGVIKNFSPRRLKKVILIDIDEEMVRAWQDLA